VSLEENSGTAASWYVEQRFGRDWPHLGARWVQQVADGGEYQQLVLPDGSADVIVFHDGTVRLVGPTMEPEVVNLPAGSTYRALRLRPGAVRSAIGVPAVELRDQVLALGDVVRPGAARALGLAASGHAAATHSLQHRWESSASERRLRGVIGWLARNGSANVDEVASATGLSGRQLRRLLLEHVGVGPKSLQRVFRLQRFLQLADGQPAAGRLADLAADVGYADQAHLTREVKRLSGLTPAALLRKRGGG